MTQVFDRRLGVTYTEPQFGGQGLRLLYGGPAALAVTNALLARRWFSRLLAWPSTWRRSAATIPAFVRDYGVDLADYPDRAYSSFADFFTREFRPGARPVDPDPHRLVAPADAKLLAYPVTDSLAFEAKGFTYRLADLVARAAVPESRWCLVFRLTVDDCHRYCFVDDCDVAGSYDVPGRLHTVGPWSNGRVCVLSDNDRVVTTLLTRHFGTVTMIEIGAMMVGRIVNHDVAHAWRGQEKGYFAYGGSTIVLLVGPLHPDDDIVAKSRLGIETRVRRGEGIGSPA